MITVFLAHVTSVENVTVPLEMYDTVLRWLIQLFYVIIFKCILRSLRAGSIFRVKTSGQNKMTKACN